MRRPLRFLPHLLIAASLAGALAFGLATRFPEAPILAAAEEWPGVGPLAVAFRRRWTPAVRSPRDRASPLSEVEGGAGLSPLDPDPAPRVVEAAEPDLARFMPKVWAPAGTVIYERPDLRARPRTRVERFFPLSLLERRGDWFEVRYGNLRAGFSRGWVHLPDYREPTPEELSAPSPVLPLAPVPLRREEEDVARRWMEGDPRSGRCGVYRLLTDVEDPELLRVCQRVGSRIEDGYRSRYGLEPIGVAAETVLLFRREEDYRAFRDEIDPELGGAAHASAAGGYVALPAAGRRARQVSHHLIHELTHLLNRRALGPALPPWLDEGLARDLSLAGLDGGERGLQSGPSLPLSALLDLDQRAFRVGAERNYRSAAQWIHYLLDGPEPELARGLRDFFDAVAVGEPIHDRLLFAHLGREAAELEAGFRAWEGG